MPLTGSEELYRTRYRDYSPDVIQQMERAGDRTAQIIQNMTTNAGNDIRSRGRMIGEGVGGAVAGLGEGLAGLRDWKDLKRRQGLAEESQMLGIQGQKMGLDAQSLELNAQKAEESFLNEAHQSPAPTGDRPGWQTPGDGFNSSRYAPSMGMPAAGGGGAGSALEPWRSEGAGKAEEAVRGGVSRRQAMMRGKYDNNMAEYAMGDYRRGHEQRSGVLSEEGLGLQNQLTKKSIAQVGAGQGLQLQDRREQQALQGFMVGHANKDEGMIAETRKALSAAGFKPHDIARIEGIAKVNYNKEVQANADVNYLMKPGGQALTTGVAGARAKLEATGNAVRALSSYKQNAGNELVPGDLPGPARMGLKQFTTEMAKYNPNAGDVDSIETNWKSGGITTPSKHMNYVLDDTIKALRSDIDRMKLEARGIDGTTVGAATRDVMQLEQQLMMLEAQAKGAGVNGGGNGANNTLNLLSPKKQGNSSIFQGRPAGGSMPGVGTFGGPKTAPQAPPPPPAGFGQGAGVPPQAATGSFRHLAGRNS